MDVSQNSLEVFSGSSKIVPWTDAIWRSLVAASEEQVSGGRLPHREHLHME